MLDGGAVVIRGQPRNGPPPERTLALAEIDAPRLARRPGAPNAGPSGTPDEPLAWEGREFLRKLLVGKPVLGCVSHTVPSGREYGTVLFGSQVSAHFYFFIINVLAPSFSVASIDKIAKKIRWNSGKCSLCYIFNCRRPLTPVRTPTRRRTPPSCWWARAWPRCATTATMRP